MTVTELAVLTPTRGRPGNAMRLARQFEATCTAETRLVLLVDPDDPHLSGYMQMRERLPSRSMVWRLPRRMRLGPTLNWAAAEVAHAESIRAIGFMGDDHLPRTAGWDRLILDELDRLGDGFVYGNDLIQGERLPTACFTTKTVVQTLEYFVPAGLIHLYIDDAWKALGQAMDRLGYLPDVVIEHLHPTRGTAPMDAGYAEVNSPEMYSEDHQRFTDWQRHLFEQEAQRLRSLLQ